MYAFYNKQYSISYTWPIFIHFLCYSIIDYYNKGEYGGKILFIIRHGWIDSLYNIIQSIRRFRKLEVTVLVPNYVIVLYHDLCSYLLCP